MNIRKMFADAYKLLDEQYGDRVLFTEYESLILAIRWVTNDGEAGLYYDADIDACRLITTHVSEVLKQDITYVYVYSAESIETLVSEMMDS